jgi:hypothetical protein
LEKLLSSVNKKEVAEVETRPLSFTSFPVHDSVFTVFSHALEPGLLKLAINVTYEVLTAEVVNIKHLFDVTLCSLVGVYQRV